MKTIHDKRVEAAVQVMEAHRHVMVAPGPHECSCGEVLDGWAAAHKKHVAHVALKAADAVVTEEQVMTPAGVIATVIETHKDTIGTHHPKCWKYHAACLAVLLRDLGVE